VNDYRSLEALLHDAFWAAEETPELDWLDALLVRHPGRALEVGSGSGRLLLPLLAKGHALEGLEPAAEMRELCQRAAADLGLEPVVHAAAMADFDPPSRYAAVLVPAFTLQLSDDPARDLARLHRWLDPDGLLYLSVFVPHAELAGELPEGEWYPDQQITLPDGARARLETRHRLDRAARVLDREHHYTLERDRERLEHRSRQRIRWFTPEQLHAALGAAGFTPETAVAEFDEDLPVDPEAQIITVVARA